MVRYRAKKEIKKYETFDHTADLGVIIFGQTYIELFANAAYALFDLLTKLSEVKEEISYPMEIEAADREDLLVRFLSELLYLFASKNYLCKRVSFLTCKEKSLKAETWGEHFDPQRHEIKTEIKAITYHQLEIKKSKGILKARLVFDV